MKKQHTFQGTAEFGRRSVLKAFAGAVGGMALTACGGGSGSASIVGSAEAGVPSALPAAVPPALPTEKPGAIEPIQPGNKSNELRISLPSGSQTNYPLQFGRAFAPGQVTGEPSVTLDGVPIASQQADVKTRYADGSVKFAVISVVVPSLGTAERVLAIGNKAVETRTAESRANMLARYDFEATIGVSVSGVPVNGSAVSARAMLQSLTDTALANETAAGGVNSRYWTVGPVCTTVLLCDHTTKAWDIGTNATKAIRPMFHIQFWPGIGKYHVRHIIEVADVTKLKDETGLDVTFTTGQSQPVTRLSQTGVYVYAATFQTRAYWGGTEVPRANVKHGVAYLASTKALPNYDSRITINPASVDSYAANWATKNKALNGEGYWQKAMATTGGRQDLGLMPKWDVVALYSGAAHMHDIAESHAELAGSWAFFFREGSESKTIFDSTPGTGRVISKLSRPTQFMYDGNGNMRTSGVDGFIADGSLSAQRAGWAHDHAHTPGVFWFAYLTTGSAFWHEKLMQLGAWSQFLVNPGLSYNSVGNGRASTDLIMNGVQSRGWGWQYRNRARAWWASLEGSPEQRLFDKSLSDAVAHRAGLYDVPGLMLGNTIRDAWNSNHLTWYGANTPAPRPNPLCYWEGKGGYTESQFVGSMGSVPNDWGIGAQAPWMRNFVSICLNHAVELGAAVARPLADWASHQTIAIASGPEPRHIGDYVTPDLKNDGRYYQTLEDIYDGWENSGSLTASSASGFPASGAPNTYGVTAEGYSSIAAASIAMANSAPGRAAAWAFVQPYHENTVYYSHDPRYAIVPRL